MGFVLILFGILSLGIGLKHLTKSYVPKIWNPRNTTWNTVVQEYWIFENVKFELGRIVL